MGVCCLQGAHVASVMRHVQCSSMAAAAREELSDNGYHVSPLHQGVNGEPETGGRKKIGAFLVQNQLQVRG